MLKFLKKAFPRSVAKKTSDGVFVDGVPYNSFLEKEYSDYFSSYTKKVSNILYGKQLAWLDSFFMCPPGFPDVKVSFVGKKKVFDISSKDGDYKAARLDFFLSSNEKYEGVIIVGERKIKIECSNSIVSIWISNKESSKIKLRKGFFSLSILRTSISKLVWLSGEGYSLLLSDWSSDWPTYALEIHSTKGRLGVVGFQEWSSCHANFIFPPAGDGTSLTLKSAPYWVREWEERSRKLWHISIALRVCADLINADGANKKEEDVEFVYLMAGLISCATGNFTHWRPSSSQEAGESEWERGNWASGFLCGAYGISTAILKEIGKTTNVKAQSIALLKGANWLVRDPQKPYTAIDFPPVAHWLRRSTNHGIVILASALVGLEEINRISPGTDISLALKKLKKEFWQLLNSSFKQGLYLEGIRYAQFSLQEAIAYIIYDYRKSNEDWQKYYLINFPDLPLVKDFIAAAVYPGSDIPLASWGDCPILPWKRSVINFLDSVESPDGISLYKQINSEGESIRLHENKTKEILKTEPLTLPTLLLPKAKGSDCEETSIVVKQISNSIAVISGKVGNAQCPNWKLYIIATPIHLTHNRDHDLGSFYWAVNGKICIGETPGRAAYCHNIACIKDIMLEDDEDPYKYYGSEQAESLVDREYGGELSVVKEEKGISIIRVVARDGIAYSNGNPLIKKYQRDFIILNTMEPMVFIITRGVNAEAEGDVYVNFVCPNGATDGLLIDSAKYYKLANTNATLSVISAVGSVFQVRPFERFSGSRVIEDLPRGKEFCSIALLESGKNKSTISIENTTDKKIVHCDAPSGEKYCLYISGLNSEIKVIAEGSSNVF